MHKYEIGGKTYIQRELVLGQVRDVLAILQGVRLPAVLDTFSLVAGLGEHLPGLLAVVLTEEGKSARQKDRAALAEELAETLTLPQTLQVVEDFFRCNPISLLLDRMTALAVTATGAIGSPPYASGAPGETSPAEITSSGA